MSTFPSLVVAREGLEPRGAFAESQAAWLRPQPRAVADLSRLCEEKRVGVVAHFYMDAELQGVLSSSDWAHIDIAGPCFTEKPRRGQQYGGSGFPVRALVEWLSS